MTDLPAPRRVERVLEAFGADTEFRDAVIGDLAEEFAIRAREDGVGAARRWYYRESLRVAPYLLRDWWRGLRSDEVWHLTKAVGVAGAALITLDIVTRVVLFAVDPGLVSLWKALYAMGDGWVFVFPALMLLWTVVDGVFGGYVAARLGRRAPLATALALAAAAAAVMALDAVMTPHRGALVLAFRALNVMAIVAGVVAGGALGAMRVTRDDDAVVADAARRS